MTNQTKLQTLKDQLHRIQALSAHQLDAYMQSVSLNNWPSDVVSFIVRAVNIRKKEVLNAVLTENSLAVSSNITELD